MPGRPVPETVDPGVILVDVYDGPDELGRYQFAAYWAQDIRWRGGGLVAAQVFYARLGDWAAARPDQTVLIMTDSGNVPLGQTGDTDDGRLV